MTSGTPLGVSSTTMQWEAVGAWQGGTVVDVALADIAGKIHGLLASRAGVYGWTMPVATLEPLPQGISDPDVVAVTFAGGDAEAPATAFAATMTGRLFRSVLQNDDASEREWQEVAGWAGLGMATVLAPSPAFADDQTLFIGTPTGIFRTLDNGQNWESANFGLLDEDILCLKCAPNFAESETLWAGTAGGGLYRSRNSARAWRESGIGLPDAAVQSLAFSPNFGEDRTLFVGMEEYGIFVSRDGGDNWGSFALAGQSINALACSQPDLLWAGTEDGLWRVATASGEAKQMTAAGETVMAVAASAGGQVAAGLFGSGLLLTADGTGAAHTTVWHRPEGALHTPPVVTSIGTALFALNSTGVIANSQDEGASWQEIAQGDYDSVFALAGAQIDAADGSHKSLLFAATEIGLSLWSGEQWLSHQLDVESQADDAPLGIALSPLFSNDKTLLVSTLHDQLLISKDSGVTWHEITGQWQGQKLLRAQFAPSHANEIAALTVQVTETGHFAVTVWQSFDQGQNWETLAGLTSGVPAVLMAWPHDADEHAIFLATQHRVIKLYHQGDLSTLQVHQHIFDEDLRVTALSPAPDYPYSKIIWAATVGGLYRSVDRGLSWVLMLDLPLGLPVVWLDVTTTYVTIITLGGRVWRAAL